MSDEESFKRMVTYLHRHATTYNLNALRRQLIAQGERPDLVDAALTRVRAELSSPVDQERALALWIAGGSLLVALLGSVILQGGGFTLLWLNITTLYFLILITPLLLIAGLIWRTVDERIGSALMLAAALNVVVFLVLFGTCVVVLSNNPIG